MATCESMRPFQVFSTASKDPPRAGSPGTSVLEGPSSEPSLCDSFHSLVHPTTAISCYHKSSFKPTWPTAPSSGEVGNGVPRSEDALIGGIAIHSPPPSRAKTSFGGDSIDLCSWLSMLLKKRCFSSHGLLSLFCCLTCREGDLSGPPLILFCLFFALRSLKKKEEENVTVPVRANELMFALFPVWL